MDETTSPIGEGPDKSHVLSDTEIRKDPAHAHRSLSRTVIMALETISDRVQEMQRSLSDQQEDLHRVLAFLDGNHTKEGADVALRGLSLRVTTLEGRIEKCEKYDSRLTWWMLGIFAAVIGGIVANFPILMKHLSQQ